MQTGIVFDIREFAVHDGPGIRTTVFMKGCPLACMWCHNPEGQSFEPELMVTPNSTRLAGKTYRSDELAALLKEQKDIFAANEGGVTFSGGEPLYQAAFIAEVIDQLEGIHVVLDTSGYGPEEALRRLLPRIDLAYFDLKIMDPESHKTYTGVDNAPILRNLAIISDAGVPFVIRVPLIPNTTDTNANLEAIARHVKGLPGLVEVDLLPYNKAAGAKYKAVGKTYAPDFDVTQPVNANRFIFEQAGIKVSIK